MLPDDKQPEPVRSATLDTRRRIFVSRHPLNIVDKACDWGKLNGKRDLAHCFVTPKSFYLTFSICGLILGESMPSCLFFFCDLAKFDGLLKDRKAGFVVRNPVHAPHHCPGGEQEAGRAD